MMKSGLWFPDNGHEPGCCEEIPEPHCRLFDQAEISDREYYFAKDHLMTHRATQPETLERLESDYGSDAPMEINLTLKEQLEKSSMRALH